MDTIGREEPPAHQTAVVDQIADLVRAGEIAPGGRLPSERMLALRFGVGRPAVREALHALERSGVISTFGRRGSFLNSFRPAALVPADLSLLTRHVEDADLLHGVEARRVIETALAALAAERRAASHLTAMARNLEMMRSAVAGDRDTVALDVEFHQLITEASGNPVLARSLESISGLLQRSREITSRTPAAPGKALAFHLGIFRAVADADPAAARRAMDVHLDDVEVLLRRELGVNAEERTPVSPEVDPDAPPAPD